MAGTLTRRARVLPCLVFLCLCSARSGAATIAGTYSGRYQCGRWNTAELKITEAGGNRISAVLTFPLAGMGLPQDSARYELVGQYDGRSGKFRLQPQRWIGPQPPGMPMNGMEGTFDPASKRLSGTMMNFTCGAFELAAGADGAAISGTVVLPPTLPPPERRTAPSVVLEAWKGTFEYLDAAMSDGLGSVRESEPIDDVFDRMAGDKLSCIGTSHVSWDATGTKGTAADRVYVTERFVIECDGDCRNVRYTPRVDGVVLHFGLTTPVPVLQIKTTIAGGNAFRWEFTRVAGPHPPPDISVHQWSASKFNNGSPGCRPPKVDNR